MILLGGGGGDVGGDGGGDCGSEGGGDCGGGDAGARIPEGLGNFLAFPPHSFSPSSFSQLYCLSLLYVTTFFHIIACSVVLALAAHKQYINSFSFPVQWVSEILITKVSQL